MASLAQARTDLAALLTAIGGAGLTVRTRPVANPKTGDGWVNVGRVEPGGTYTACAATLTAVLVLGADQRKADDLLEQLAVTVVNAVTTGALHPDSVSIEPATLPAGDVSSGPLYALLLTLTLEVDS